MSRSYYIPFCQLPITYALARQLTFMTYVRPRTPRMTLYGLYGSLSCGPESICSYRTRLVVIWGTPVRSSVIM